VRIVALVAAVALSWTWMAPFVSRLADSTVVCCCGEHEAHEPCGCPTCPAKAHASDHGSHAHPSDLTTIGACAPVKAAVAALMPFVMPAPLSRHRIDQPPERLPRPPDTRLPASLVQAPDLRPPERVHT
jgi:hypothetical protein